MLSKSELENRLSKHFADEGAFQAIWTLAKDEGYVALTRTGARLTDEGQEWLDDHAAEFDVELEDSGSDGGPNRPYAVAKLKMETKHLSVFQALRKIEKQEIDLSPEFQRAFVWDEVRQSRLIESVLIRIPLPAFYLDATDQVNWKVVDGLQRLTTLDRYCRKQGFALRGLQFLRELEGSTFESLPAKYRVLIEDDTQLLFYNLMPGTPVEAKFTIFSRVNTGGMQLTPQEIRHALNQGPVTRLLGKLAKNSTFLKATQGVVESLRMSDRELILRAISFMHMGVDSYKEFNEMDAFLLASMSEINDLPKSELERLGAEFVESLEKVTAVFGRYAFRKFYVPGGRRSPFNKALFETWIVAVSEYDLDTLKRHRQQIITEFAKLVNSSENFVRSISSSTGSFSAVHTRFSRIERLLEEFT